MEKSQNKGQDIEIRQIKSKVSGANLTDFVLEKSIFNNIFEKDIRKIFIYKKAERLAKAIHLITPAFADSESLKNRLDSIAVNLVDAAIVSSSAARTSLSRELLTLSSVLGMARSSGLLSLMNVELISRETHTLLQEVAEYEEPRVTLEESPSLSGLAKMAPQTMNSSQSKVAPRSTRPQLDSTGNTVTHNKGHIKDINNLSDTQKDRREAVMSVIRSKKVASIKDISTVIRNVSEKTIQRELLALVAAGTLIKQGERRWSTYSLNTIVI